MSLQYEPSLEPRPESNKEEKREKLLALAPTRRLFLIVLCVHLASRWWENRSASNTGGLGGMKSPPRGVHTYLSEDSESMPELEGNAPVSD